MINAVTTDSLMTLASALPNIFDTMGNDSLIEYSKTTQVEPLVLIDIGLQNQDFVSELLVTFTNIFSAYYLQAIALSNTVGSVTVLKRLSKFAPKRSLKDASILMADSLSTESYGRNLPRFGSAGQPYHQASLEAAHTPAPKKLVASASDSLASVKNIDSLAVGKLLQVDIIHEDKTLTVPVSVKLQPVGIAPSVFVSCYSEGSYKNNAIERMWRMAAGELSAVGDLIFCNDLIDTHKKNLKLDKSGIYAETVKRRRNNKLAAVMTNTPSVASASNIAIISTQTALQWERELGVSLDSASQREKVFSASSLMMFAVVDTEWETVKIYYRSIAKATELGLRDMKTVNKNTGPDILEMIRAFTASPKTGSGPLI